MYNNLCHWRLDISTKNNPVPMEVLIAKDPGGDFFVNYIFKKMNLIIL